MSEPRDTHLRLWKRDELGEYHDRNGNLIYQDEEGWWLIKASGIKLGPFVTLREAKRNV